MGIPKKMRQELETRAGFQCEICGRWNADNAHHRKNRSQGGRNELSNLMLLCGSGTTGCHGFVTEHPSTAAHHGWRVKSFQTPSDVAVSVRGRWVRLCDDGSVVPVQQEGA